MFKNEIKTADGLVRIDAKHGGRIFVELNGEIIHNFNAKLLKNFDPVAFNNLGGNSLWPAPEGGDFAFNYLGGDWLVQPGVNTAESQMVANMTCERTVPMKNRKGADMDMVFRRKVSVIDDVNAIAGKYNVSAIAYHEDDAIEFTKPMDAKKAVVAAWSLEQFPGAEGVIAFGKVDGVAQDAINRNFYGNPEPRLTIGPSWFKFILGGANRLQIGISAQEKPAFIGAFDTVRKLLVIRKCERGTGKRIDIADNDQPNGIYGADDQFSIFNGATLNFFELETIAPMTMDARKKVTGSTLSADTYIFRGPRENLLAILKNLFAMPESFKL